MITAELYYLAIKLELWFKCDGELKAKKEEKKKKKLNTTELRKPLYGMHFQHLDMAMKTNTNLAVRPIIIIVILLLL